MNRKSILITGAASGIGRETALFFAKKDWFVGIFDVNEAGLKTLESEIGASNCFSGIMDVTDPDSVQKGIDAFAGEMFTGVVGKTHMKAVSESTGPQALETLTQ